MLAISLAQISQSMFARLILAVIVLHDTTVRRNFCRDACVSTIDFSHKCFPHLVTSYIGVLILVFQPIADCEFPILIEYARDVEFQHSIVAEVTRQLVIILLHENEERSQVTLNREVY